MQLYRFHPEDGRWELVTVSPMDMLNLAEQKLAIVEARALVVTADRDRGVVSQRLPLEARADSPPPGR